MQRFKKGDVVVVEVGGVIAVEVGGGSLTVRASEDFEFDGQRSISVAHYSINNLGDEWEIPMISEMYHTFFGVNPGDEINLADKNQVEEHVRKEHLSGFEYRDGEFLEQFPS